STIESAKSTLDARTGRDMGRKEGVRSGSNDAGQQAPRAFIPCRCGIVPRGACLPNDSTPSRDPRLTCAHAGGTMKTMLRCFLAIALAVTAGVASAEFHTYKIEQIYTNASGTSQYIVLHESQ